MPQIKNNQITWDHRDWFAGLNPQDTRGIPYLFNGFDTQFSINPFKKLGYLSPGLGATGVTNEGDVDGVIKNIAIDVINENGYGVGGTKVYEMEPVNGAITNDGDWPHQVASSVMEDVVTYSVSGTNYLFYSWNDGTDGDIGRHTLNTSTFDDDYFTAVGGGAALDKDLPHPMTVGDDDILYVGNGNLLAKLDGTTATDAALTLPDGLVIKSFAKLNNRTLVVFTDTNTASKTIKGKVQAWFWDYVKADPYKVYDVEGSIAGGAENYMGSVAIVTTGPSTDFDANRNLHISFFNGTKFKKIRSLANTGAAPTTGGVEVIGEMMLINAGGKVFSVGSPFEGVKAGVNSIADLGGTTSGVIKKIDGTDYIASSGTTTSGGLEVLSGTDYSGTNETTAAIPIFKSGFRGKIKSITTEFYSTVSSSTGKLDLTIDNVIGGSSVVYDDLDTVTNLLDEIFRDTSGVDFVEFDKINLAIKYSGGIASGPVIKSIIVDYEEIKIN